MSQRTEYERFVADLRAARDIAALQPEAVRA
jgi:hypothetical protein